MQTSIFRKTETYRVTVEKCEKRKHDDIIHIASACSATVIAGVPTYVLERFSVDGENDKITHNVNVEKNIWTPFHQNASPKTHSWFRKCISVD